MQTRDDPQLDVLVRGTEERMIKANRVSEQPTKIHRFPQSLRGIDDGAGRYTVPTVVAIAPYHHGLSHLQEMEEVKHVAASQFCNFLNRSVKEVYGNILLPIAGEARSYYTTTDGSVSSLSDAKLAEMMFLDGCILLNFVVGMETRDGEQVMVGHSRSCWPTIAKDILLLENQIPWRVLEALTENRIRQPIMEFFREWVDDNVLKLYFLDKKEEEVASWNMWWLRWLELLGTQCRWRDPDQERSTADHTGSDRNSTSSNGGSDPKPLHLLDLLWLRMTRGMPEDMRRGKRIPNASLAGSSSAVYLSQIGLKLTASTNSWFADVQVQKHPLLFGELSLTPLFLNEVTACILTNVVALEVARATNCPLEPEDVQKLRERGVLCAHFSNAQTLDFFKGLAQHLRLGFNYFAVVRDIDAYIRQRPVRIAVHSFVYNNFKIIASVLSIASVLVGIFQALYSA
ncbi:hypothetical protein U9M48_005382 [Paspalum notatum var. saurae]|uniref:Uncharacterized protein n=1 Tax=Paspalum notatum var. saurae TaxID=547442 RepID=A0AAQ3PM90_PASNO